MVGYRQVDHSIVDYLYSIYGTNFHNKNRCKNIGLTINATNILFNVLLSLKFLLAIISKTKSSLIIINVKVIE